MAHQTLPDRILIVGAGMAGLTAAKLLTEAGRNVLVLDKGRGVGGRMATRRFGNGRFDHGAQYFTARDEKFQQLVEDWERHGVVVEWSQGFPVYPDQPATGNYPRYRGLNGMTSVPKYLAQGLNVRLQTRVTAVHQEKDHWLVDTQTGEQFRGQALLLTAPVSQTLALLDAGQVSLPDDVCQGLESVAYHPCLALMVLVGTPSKLPTPGGVRFSEGPIAWIADNHQKGISPKSNAVTIHASPEFSRVHWQTDAKSVMHMLMDAASSWLPQNLVDWQLHRWRYAQVKTRYPAPMLCLPGAPVLAMAGDAFGGARVEGAALSGYEVAQKLLRI